MTTPIIDPDFEKALNLALEYVALANSSLHDAIESRDVAEREAFESMADMALFQLQTLQIFHPALKLPNLADFEGDLKLTKNATRELRKARWRRKG